MEKLKESKGLEKLRGSLIQSLNELGLNGRPILAMVRKAEPFHYFPGEEILEQNKRIKFVFFLLEGQTEISITERGQRRTLGKRGPITTLGEIAYFNQTPATASVSVAGSKPATVFRLSYSDFGKIIDQHPDVRETLARIGEMRIIRQYHGFVSFHLFMDLIGWRKDRFAINRAFAEDLENSIRLTVLPLLDEESKLLEVGDGPGLVCELLHSGNHALLDGLYIQATHLEKVILDPLEPQPSSLLRAKDLKEKFDFIIALQVFNVSSRKAVDEEFEIAKRLLNPGGHLFIVKSQLLDVRYPTRNAGGLLFDDLEKLVKQTWAGSLNNKHLIQTVFLDADLDPEMEWNVALSESAGKGKLKIPKSASKEETFMLELLLGQAKQRIFDPERLQFQWLEWKAKQHGFHMRKSESNPENSFFFQLLQRD